MNHRLVFAAALTAGLVAGTANAAPSFDCATATSFREQAVCRDQRLANLDQDMSTAYARALARFDSVDAARLRQDQRNFIAAIDAGFEHMLAFGRTAETMEAELNDVLEHRDRVIGPLEDAMRRRLRFLTSLQPGRRSLTGRWQSTHAVLTVTQDTTGFAAGFATSTFGFARYNCDFEARFMSDNGGLRADAAKPKYGEEAAVQLTLRRRGAALELREIEKQPFEGWFCQHVPELHEVLFPVTEAD